MDQDQKQDLIRVSYSAVPTEMNFKHTQMKLHLLMSEFSCIAYFSKYSGAIHIATKTERNSQQSHLLIVEEEFRSFTEVKVAKQSYRNI